MVTIVAVSAAMMSSDLINQYAAIRIATNDAFTGALGAAQSVQLALLFTDLKTNGFFPGPDDPLGCGCCPSLTIAGCSLLTEMFAHLLDAPGIIATLPVSAGAELSFFARLLAKASEPRDADIRPART